MAQCTKQGYPNPAAALRAMRVIRVKLASRGGKVPVRVYPCESCKSRHLTSEGKTRPAMS
jgi:hypothetical protein